MNQKNRYTITAALPYANGPIHIGHLAGNFLPSDIFVKYLRLKKEDVVFICGSDQHGAAITITAEKENIPVEDLAEKYHILIKNTLKDFDIDFDIYSKTSSDLHKKTASDFFSNLFEKNIFEEKVSNQFFDEDKKKFLADRYLKGICPICKKEDAYGDQCEKCGSTLNSLDLINPISTLSGKTPILKQTKHWYFPLGDFQNFLEKWILEDHRNWKENVYFQCKSWLDKKLESRAITRDMDWGVPIPIENEKGKVLYVWFEAPIGYISATKEWAEKNNKDWEPYWKDKNTKLIHFIGKDNIVFHCIIFPAMLKAHGDFILPEDIPANEFLNLEGKKISTSKNWAIWLDKYLEEFPNAQDSLRYAIISNFPENRDCDFTLNDFKNKHNGELVAILGNLINRIVVLSFKFFDGKIFKVENNFEKKELDILEFIKNQKIVVSSFIENYRFKEALFEVMKIPRFLNKYLDEEKPWKAFETNQERVKVVINFCLEILFSLSIFLYPFLPFTSKKIKKTLNIEKKLFWEDILNFDILEKDQQIKKNELFFNKIENKDLEKIFEKLSKR
jgi:methionyl-tRNA synthetase